MNEPSIRKPLGILLILALITVWAVLVAFAAHWISMLPNLVQAVVYLVAGVAWILPLKPLLRWMEASPARE